jgi:hypothetical protein
MGYLAQGNHIAFFIRISDKKEIEAMRLYSTFKRTKSKRVKKKIAKRIDSMVKVDELL